ncbi:MAG: alanine dehydrogenase [Anaerolineales bacterium]|nr:alanine dehydrogenase [Anaerolineales bacterium]
MNICIPKERRDSEYRVGLTPAGIQLLTQQGHICFIEKEAGVGSGFSDHAYQEAGATIVYSGEEIYGRADLILKVSSPIKEEYDWMQEGLTLLGFLHLSAGGSAKVDTLLSKNITAIGYEIIQIENGSLPVLRPLSQLAGRMIPQVAATLAQNNYGGKGFYVGGVPGIPRANVVILGAGTVGRNAARSFLGLGANVHMLDSSLEVLQQIDREFSTRVNTLISYPFNIHKICSLANIFVGAILVPGASSPVVVTREMVQQLHPRSIIIDSSIDQGGCFETSRPTTHSNPTYLEEDVIHYCVPNMTGVLGRTGTHVLSNAIWPYIAQIAELGIKKSLKTNPALNNGVYIHQGKVVKQVLTNALEGRKKL